MKELVCTFLINEGLGMHILEQLKNWYEHFGGIKGYKLTNYKLQLDSLKIYNNPVNIIRRENVMIAESLVLLSILARYDRHHLMAGGGGAMEARNG